MSFNSLNAGMSYGVPVMGKSWYASKTIWVNIAGIIVMIGTLFGLESDIAVELEAAILAIANIGLRIITGEPLK